MFDRAILALLGRNRALERDDYRKRPWLPKKLVPTTQFIDHYITMRVFAAETRKSNLLGGLHRILDDFGFDMEKRKKNIVRLWTQPRPGGIILSQACMRD